MTTHTMELSHQRMFRRWFSFLGGGVAWTYHLLTIYVIGEFGCVSGFDRHVFAGISAVAWMLIIVSVIALVPAVAATVIGYVDTRRDARETEKNPYEEGGRYLSSFGWPLNGVFTLIIFVESLPVFGYLGGC
ncbi:MAG: hypothetical protein SCH71_07050 [Desulfobulbaceae bacterium]|nr:hypothetical protein [Desulfobulbaceae bacterium]